MKTPARDAGHRSPSLARRARLRLSDKRGDAQRATKLSDTPGLSKPLGFFEPRRQQFLGAETPGLRLGIETVALPKTTEATPNAEIFASRRVPALQLGIDAKRRCLTLSERPQVLLA